MTDEAREKTGFRAGLARLPMPPVPLFVLRPLLARLIDSLMARHPGLFDRLGPYGDKRFVLDPLDLPFALLLRPRMEAPSLEPVEREVLPPHDALIRGRLDQLVEMVNGERDGDALFFSRELLIEGDTEAVLALRNAVDDQEIDLETEILALLGPLEGPARQIGQRAGEAALLLEQLRAVVREGVFGRSSRRTGAGNSSQGNSSPSAGECS